MLKSKLTILLTILVLGISLFTHFYRIDKTYVFQNDEGRDALIALKMIQTGRPVLLGPETSVGNMYLGPFYYYLIAPSLWLSGLDPVGPAMMVALLAVFTTYLLILLGKKYYSYNAGLLAGLFYAVSPVMVHYSRSSWNPNVIPLFVSLMLLFYPLAKKWHALLFGLLSGIIFQLHYVSLVVPALLGLKFVYDSIKKSTTKDLLSNLVLIIIGFFITSLPFWLFESRHGFINSQAFLTYLSAKSTASNLGYPPYYLRLFANLQLFLNGLFGSASMLVSPLSWLIVASLGLILLFFICSVGGILSYLTLASLIIVSVLKENIYIHYLGFLFPIASVIVGVSATHKNWFLKAFTWLFLVSLILPTYHSLKYNLFELESTQPRRAEETARYINAESGGKPYNVVNASNGSSATILYYLAISANPPKTTTQPLLFVICQNSLCPKDIETSTSLFLNGPSHPTAIDYLGYTPSLYSAEKRTIIKNEWVTYDVNIATVNR